MLHIGRREARFTSAATPKRGSNEQVKRVTFFPLHSTKWRISLHLQLTAALGRRGGLDVKCSLDSEGGLHVEVMT
jgi:hypothetical protein